MSSKTNPMNSEHNRKTGPRGLSTSRTGLAGWRGVLRRIAVAALLGVVVLSRPVEALEIGATFPSFAGYRLEGALPPDLAGKVAVIDFWASWCAPCKAAFPTLSALQTEFGSRGVVVLGISVDEKPSAFEQFRKRLKPTFTTLLDREHRLAVDLSVPTMPTTFVVDRTGRVRFVHAGFDDATPATLRKQILELLEEKS